MDILRSVRISLTAPGITEEKVGHRRDIASASSDSRNNPCRQRTPLGMASGILATILGSALEHENEIANFGSPEAIVIVMASTIQQELCAVPNRIELYGKGLVGRC
jgi:hypothetical protein